MCESAHLGFVTQNCSVMLMLHAITTQPSCSCEISYVQSLKDWSNNVGAFDHLSIGWTNLIIFRTFAATDRHPDHAKVAALDDMKPMPVLGMGGAGILLETRC